MVLILNLVIIFKIRGIIRFDTDDTFPLDSMVNVYSMTAFIKSIYRTYYNIYHPQNHLQIVFTCKATNVYDIYKKC